MPLGQQQPVIPSVLDQPTTGLHQPLTKRLYTKAEAAQYLGRSKRSIDSLVSSGALRRVTGEGHPMFDIKDLDKYIERCKET